MEKRKQNAKNNKNEKKMETTFEYDATYHDIPVKTYVSKNTM